MSSMEDEQAVKALRKQCFKLTEQLAKAMQEAELYKAYRELFEQTREGFCKIRAQYKQLHNERPDIPSWDQILKLAGERGKILGGLRDN